MDEEDHYLRYSHHVKERRTMKMVAAVAVVGCGTAMTTPPPPPHCHSHGIVQIRCKDGSSPPQSRRMRWWCRGSN